MRTAGMIAAILCLTVSIARFDNGGGRAFDVAALVILIILLLWDDLHEDESA